MLVAAAGDCHGQLSLLYEGVETLEQEMERPVDLVLQVGDLGVWPDPARIDKAAQHRLGAGEFASWLERNEPVPRRTVFIAGNHEDFDFLDARETDEILPGLTFLASGQAVDVDVNGDTLRIGGVGGCFGPSDFEKEELSGRRRRHYTRRQLEQLAKNAAGGLDILLLHDAPAGRLVAMRDTRERPYQRNCPTVGLVELLEATRPRICLTGHWHIRSERTVAGSRTVGLSAIPYAGSLLLLEFTPLVDEPIDRAELGGQLAGNRSPDVTLTPPDPTILDLAKLLDEWARRARGNTPPSRKQRLQFHDQYKSHPWFPLLMPAFKGEDVEAAIESSVPHAKRQSLLDQWREGGLPQVACRRES